MIATVLSRAYDQPVESRPRPQAVFIWERSAKVSLFACSGLRVLARQGRPTGRFKKRRNLMTRPCLLAIWSILVVAAVTRSQVGPPRAARTSGTPTTGSLEIAPFARVVTCDPNRAEG